jgi:hypothetical protein
MTRNRVLHGALAALLLLPLTASAVELLPFSATYKSRHGVVSATGERELKAIERGQWQLTNRAKLLMVEVTEQSTFVLNDGAVQSVSYEFVNPFRSERSQSLQFDWPQKLATDHKSKEQVELPERAFDKLNYQAQLQLDACANPANFQTRDYLVVDRGRIKTYRVESKGIEVLATGVGSLRTLKLRQYRPDRQEKETLVWMATEWNCLLAKIEDRDEDEVVSLSLVKAAVNGVAVTGK